MRPAKFCSRQPHDFPIIREEILDEYLEATGIGGEPVLPCSRPPCEKTGKLSLRALARTGCRSMLNEPRPINSCYITSYTRSNPVHHRLDFDSQSIRPRFR